MNKYVTISLPKAIAEDIDQIMKNLGYWPSRGAFVREACIAKIRKEQKHARVEEDVEG